MDDQTLAAYDRSAVAFAQEWDEQPPPLDMQALLRQHFRHGPTADIGSGSGRDAAWLSANGFPCVGYEPSAGLLAEARRLHPEVTFQQASLPDLAEVANASFANVLCETVIMHLERGAIGPSVRRLLEILARGGTLWLAWRVTEQADRRDDRGRLYAAFDPRLVEDELVGVERLYDQTETSASSGRIVRRLIVRKTLAP